MTLLVDMTGAVLGGIRVLGRAAPKGGRPTWECSCHCGARFSATGTALRLGKTKECPTCARTSRVRSATKHGDVGSREYIAYGAMKSRCYDPSNKRYPRYGGRGIAVCGRWLAAYSNFLFDMGRQPSPQHTLERINTDGDYEPSNCRWATLIEQANNRSNNTRIEIEGRTQTLTQWSRETGVNRTVILKRIKRGLSGAALIKKSNHGAST